MWKPRSDHQAHQMIMEQRSDPTENMACKPSKKECKVWDYHDHGLILTFLKLNLLISEVKYINNYHRFILENDHI
jgi:hypothetical protein